MNKQLFRKGSKGECWPWLGHKKSSGYGQKWFNGRIMQAHRWVYEQCVGPIPEGMDLDHLCRNRSCVNPNHLEPVSRARNVQRGKSAALNALQVRVIRHCRGRVRQVDLGNIFGVAQNTISRVQLQKGWTDMPEVPPQ